MKQSALHPFGLLSALALAAAAPSLPAQTPPAAAPTAANYKCVIIHGHSAGDDALAAEKYKDAETFFRAQITANPLSLDARLGLVLALDGEDNLTAAKDEVAAMVKQSPTAALTEVAAAEAAYRAGDFVGATNHARAAVNADRCEGRAFDMLGDLMHISGYYAREAALYTTAHRLRPDDEIIRRDWISTLTPAARLDALKQYLETKPNVSEKESRALDNTVGRLEKRKPNECRLATRPASVTTPLVSVLGESGRPSAYGLDVQLDGKKRRLQIDTGASGIVLTRSSAKALNIEAEIHTRTGGIGKTESDTILFHVPTIRIGELEFDDCMVSVIEHSPLEVDGLIGMDFLSRYLVTLDYQNRELKLDQLPPRPGEAPSDLPAEASAARDRYIAPEMQDFESILRIGHAILLPVGTNLQSHHFIIMDTGAEQSIFSLPFAREVSKTHSTSIEFRGVSGKVNDTYITDDVALRAGTLVLPSSKYFAIDMTNISHDLGFETAGLLGLPTLQRLKITIDYRDNLVKLKYDPKHDRMIF